MKRQCLIALLLLTIGCACAPRSTHMGTWEHTRKDGAVVGGEFDDLDELFDRTRWLEDGTLKVSFSSGHGESCSLDTISGEKHQRCKSWYPNGQLSMERSLVNGDYDGPYSYWDERGELVRQGVFSHGKQTGVWVEREPATGRLVERTYNEGGRE